MTARGLTNFNPGNIRLSVNNNWLGQVHPGTDPDFCQFDTMIHGIRALAEILINYQIIHKLAPSPTSSTIGRPQRKTTQQPTSTTALTAPATIPTPCST